MKHIEEWTQKDFKQLPFCDKDIGTFTSLVILPAISKWDYRRMGFVAVKKDIPLCRLTENTTLIHLNGVSGFGKDGSKKHTACPSIVPPVLWNITCLRVSGLLRIFSLKYELSIGVERGFFELFTDTEYLDYAQVDYKVLNNTEINLIKAHRRMIKS